MSLKSLWLDNRELKGLKIDIEHINTSKELDTQLDDAIKDNEGKYLCNIFSDKAIRELEGIKENYFIEVFLKHGLQKRDE